MTWVESAECLRELPLWKLRDGSIYPLIPIVGGLLREMGGRGRGVSRERRAWTLPGACSVFLRADHRSSSFVSEGHRTKCRKTSVCLETDTEVNLWAKGNVACSCTEREVQGWRDVKEAQDINSKRPSKAVYLMMNKSIRIQVSKREKK